MSFNSPLAYTGPIQSSENMDTLFVRALEVSSITDGTATLSNGTLSNLNDPTSAKDGANKQYVDSKTGAVPAGNDGSVQFKGTNGLFAGDNNLIYQAVLANLVVPNLEVSNYINNSIGSMNSAQIFTSALNMSGDISMANNNIVGLPLYSQQSIDPTSATSKSYVDQLLLQSNVSWKNEVNGCSVSSVSLFGTVPIDGVPRLSGYRFLLKNQGSSETDPSTANGIYVSDINGNLTRPPDCAITITASGAAATVIGGDINKGRAYICNSYSTSYAPVLFGSAITFVSFGVPGIQQNAIQFNSGGHFDSVSKWLTDGSATLYGTTGSLLNLSDNSTISVGSTGSLLIYSSGSSAYIQNPITNGLTKILMNTGGILMVNNIMNITESGILSITSSVPSTSNTTGSLVILGGLGLTGSVFVGESLTVNSTTSTLYLSSQTACITSTTDSVSSTTGSLIVKGGIGVSKNVYANQFVSTSQTNPPFSVASTALVQNLYVQRAVVSDIASSITITGPINITGTTSSINSQTGSGSTFVVQNSPTILSALITGPTITSAILVSPDIGSATGVSLNLTTAATASQFVSTSQTNPPFSVASTSLVQNLYAQRAVSSDNASSITITGPINITGTTSSINSQTGSGSTFVVQNSPTILSALITSPTITNAIMTNAIINNSTLTGPTLVSPIIGSATGVSLNLTTSATASQFVSSVGNGTPPLVVSSNTLVPSLYVQRSVSSDNAGSINISGPINITGSTSSINAQTGTGSIFVVQTTPTLVNPFIGVANGSSLNLGTSATASQFVSTIGNGTPPLVVSSNTLVPSLYAQRSVSSDNATTASSITVSGPINISGSTSSINAQTGTGSVFVVQTTPTLTSPFIGVANGSSLNLETSATASQFVSSIGNGTSPFVVSSTTLVSGLYAQRSVSSDNATTASSITVSGPINIAGSTSSINAQTGTGSVFVVQTNPTLTSPFIGSANGTSLNLGTSATASQFISNVGNGTSPFVVSSTTLVSGLYAQRSVSSDNATTITVSGPINISGSTSSINAQTGTGSVFVVQTTPTLINPFIGIANGTSINLGTSATASQFVSSVGNGTSPFVVSSTTLVSGLYAQRSVSSDNATTITVSGPINITGSTSSINAQTGTGSVFVVQTTPTLVNPFIGSANGTSLNLGASATASQFVSTTSTNPPFRVASTALVSGLYSQRSVLSDTATLSSAAGFTSYVQYNVSSLFAGSPNFTFDGTNSLTLGASTGVGTLLLSSGGSIINSTGTLLISNNLSRTTIGGVVNIVAGNGATNGSGGSITLTAGTGAGTGAGGSILLNAGSSSTGAIGNVQILTSTNAISPSTGSLVVGGGIGISDSMFIGSTNDPTTTSGALVVSGGILVKSTTQSTHNTSGAMIILGGLGVAKDIYAASFNSPSDISLKTNIKKLENCLERVDKIEVYSYNWNQNYESYNDIEQFGFIAQQLEDIGLGNLVSGSNRKSVNYISAIPLLTGAIKDLKTEVDGLKKLIQTINKN